MPDHRYAKPSLLNFFFGIKFPSVIYSPAPLERLGLGSGAVNYLVVGRELQGEVMSEIILCKQTLSASYFKNNCGISIDSLFGVGCVKPETLTAYTPYYLGKDNSVDRGIITQLSPMPVARELTHLSLSFGADNTLALAEMTQKLQEYNISLLGASTSIYAERMGGFVGSVKQYQSALMEYRSALRANPAVKAAAKQKAHMAFEKMQLQFRHELMVVNSRVKSNRGTPLTSAQRATNIADSSRNFVSLNVTSQVQANNLVRFTQHTKFLGNGLAVIDFGSRIGNIHNSYQSGGNWEKELFIESSSFAAGAITGAVAAKVGVAALTFLMVATPVGWVGLVVGGVAVAGAAAGASIGMSNYVKNNSGSIYDKIMGWFS